jgi:mycoredoxin
MSAFEEPGVSAQDSGGNRPVPDRVSPVVTRTGPPTNHAEIVVYWRPGCGFCSVLRRQLTRAGVAHRLVNIWEDPDAAARVRSVARGYETVPTVMVGAVPLVNPSMRQVVAAAEEHAPGAIEGFVSPPRPSLGGLAARVFGR